MQVNSYPIVAVAVESANPLVNIEQNTCDCDMGFWVDLHSFFVYLLSIQKILLCKKHF